jgi:transcription elongation factor Elf1
MMDWIKNLISYSDSKSAGKCPVCGHDKIKVTEHVHGNRKSLTFICESCSASDHFDGMAANK